MSFHHFTTQMSEIPPSAVYLQPDFQSASLKVAQLRGILLQYGVSAPFTAKKADLVALFDDKVKSQAASIVATASKVKASAQGIQRVSGDGSQVDVVPPPARKRGRPSKAAKQAAEQAAEQDIKPDLEPPVKRPRGRPSKASKLVEPESVAPATPKRKVRKSDPKVKDELVVEIETTAPTSQSSHVHASVVPESPAPSLPSVPGSNRRRSVLPSSASVASDIPSYEDPSEKPLSKRLSDIGGDLLEDVKEEPEPPKSVKKTPRRSHDSGFSDYNPFQSGSEDAAERERRRRKSSIGLSTKKPHQPRFSEPAPRPNPTLRRVGPSQEELKRAPQDIHDAADREDLERETLAAEKYNHSIQAKLNALSSHDEVDNVTVTTETTVSKSLAQRAKRASNTFVAPRSTLPIGVLVLLLFGFIANYKSQSASIGFCDSGETTNNIILSRQIALDEANACIAKRTALDLDTPGAGKDVVCDISGLPLVPFLPRPTSCAPCPPHALCEQGNIVSCQPEYILSNHPLALISPALDGLFGVGPKAFPPSCKPDTVKKRMIGGLAKSMESDLARSKGDVVCAGAPKNPKKSIGEIYGIEESLLREMYAARRDPKFTREQFDEIFEAALKDLVEHEDLIESIDVDGKSWYLASRTELTVPCAVKLHLLDLLHQWRSQLVSTAFVLAVIGYVSQTLKHRQQEKYKAEELVQVVLKRLQDQERLHYADPVVTPHAFIPPTQLRDLVLPPKGSTTSKSRLWQRVRELVEANANVATREQEVNGEVWRTWEWTGVGERHVTWDS